MKKYIRVVNNTVTEIFSYRLNFAMWRFRTVLQLLALYFLWQAVIPKNTSLGGYSHALIISYILGTQVLNAIILSSRGHEIAENIVRGDLSTFLVRPINYFAYWFSRDIGDKAMNIFFSFGEMAVLLFFLQPPLFIQTNIVTLGFFLMAVILAVILNFIIATLLSMIGFWSEDVWAPRFLFFLLISYFAGGIFPLDILPKALFFVFRLLPFTYLIFFPMKIYLGQVSFGEVLIGLGIAVFWIMFGAIILRQVWLRGLRDYAAYGR